LSRTYCSFSAPFSFFTSFLSTPTSSSVYFHTVYSSSGRT
jgi:hypothetical protein